MIVIRMNRTSARLLIPLLLAAACIVTAASCGESEPEQPNIIISPATSQSPNAPATASDDETNNADDGNADAPNTPPIPDIQLEPAFPALSFVRPVQIIHAGDGSNRLFVLEQQTGTIRVFENRSDADEAPIFLNIKERVFPRHNEEGLLAIAFHPKYKVNHQFYVYYSADKPRRGVLSQFTALSDDPNRADPASEKVILEVAQPYGNHNGATILFGPDGYLYLSLGDGGWANDPHDHGQNLSTLLGSIIRIDVDHEADGNKYAIPADNPFVNQEDARGEIWAYGLRNIWRMSFDRETGDLWGGDVGQNRYEEIDLITKGGNYGWNIREGKHPFKQQDTGATLIDPIVEYGRREGISVTGGYVYRGEAFPNLQGVYLYADYASGKVWGLRSDDGALLGHREVLKSSRRHYITSFGEDEAGELYVTTFDRLDAGGSPGRIFRVVAR